MFQIHANNYYYQNKRRNYSILGLETHVRKMPETKTAQHTANYSRLSRTVHNLYMKKWTFFLIFTFLAMFNELIGKTKATIHNYLF